MFPLYHFTLNKTNVLDETSLINGASLCTFQCLRSSLRTEVYNIPVVECLNKIQLRLAATPVNSFRVTSVTCTGMYVNLLAIKSTPSIINVC